MAADCLTIADKIIGGRPFVYLPSVLANPLETQLQILGEACATYLYVERDCERPTEGRQCCWGWNDQPPHVRYSVNGVTSITVRADATIGQNVITAVAAVSIQRVGHLVTSDGIAHEFWEGDCPQSCVDNYVHGRLAVEITGSITISNNLINYWNRSVGTLQLLVQLAFPPIEAMNIINQLNNDILNASTPAAAASYTLRGAGGGGIVYDLGPFRVPY